MDNSLKYMSLGFDVPLMHKEIGQFRGAVVSLIGREYEEFHNHNNQEDGKGGFYYRYPVIQYRVRQGKASIYAVGEGLHFLQPLLLNMGKEVQIGDRRVKLAIDDLYANEWDLRLTKERETYRLNRWLALNQENYLRYKRMGGMVERAETLERVLVNHIVSFAKSVAWQWEDRLEVRLRKIHGVRKVDYHRSHLMAFDVEWDGNVSLPSGLGLGKSVSHGFGVLHRVREQRGKK
ncbi:MAG: CRISPR-associated endonuclease Cas6 [Chitinophagales bacterium]